MCLWGGGGTAVRRLKKQWLIHHNQSNGVFKDFVRRVRVQYNEYGDSF
jgi:hypothetical protein